MPRRRPVDAAGVGESALEDELYDERFLVRRPLLAAVAHRDAVPPVLLVDEVDRADDEFEAFLLEVLSDYAVTVPEIGRFHAEIPPRVIITSNRTRDVHDALKRRCLYHWVDHPGFDQEVAIITSRAPATGEALARQVAAAVEELRELGLYKPPGVAESIDWAEALARLGATDLTEATLEASLGAVLEYREDQQRVLDAGRTGAARPGHGPRGCSGPTTAVVTVVDPTRPEAMAAAFVAALRRVGVAVPVGSAVAYFQALGALGLSDRERVYWAGAGDAGARPRGRLAVRPRVPGVLGRSCTRHRRSRSRRGLARRSPSTTRIPIPARARATTTQRSSPCATAPPRSWAARISPPTTPPSWPKPTG